MGASRPPPTARRELSPTEARTPQEPITPQRDIGLSIKRSRRKRQPAPQSLKDLIERGSPIKVGLEDPEIKEAHEDLRTVLAELKPGLVEAVKLAEAVRELPKLALEATELIRQLEAGAGKLARKAIQGWLRRHPNGYWYLKTPYHKKWGDYLGKTVPEDVAEGLSAYKRLMELRKGLRGLNREVEGLGDLASQLLTLVKLLRTRLELLIAKAQALLPLGDIYEDETKV